MNRAGMSRPALKIIGSDLRSSYYTAAIRANM
ncbi:hypothetical protein VPHK567_0372 [Vibrio phage K567]